MINLPWHAGLEKGDPFASFSTEQAAVQWTQQFGNKMYVWRDDEDSDNGQ